jgi:polyisoprenoid-binding protein YceI
MIWTIDSAHALVEFSVKHMAISTVRGHFKSFSGSGETNEAGMPTSLRMEIETGSVFTNNDQRDAHLRSGDFFDAETFPKMTFTSRKVSGAPDDLRIEGDLTIRGETHPVTLKGEMSQVVKDPWGNQRTSLAVTGKLSREKWGLTWNQALEFGGLMVSDEVKLSIEAEAIEVPADAGATVEDSAGVATNA